MKKTEKITVDCAVYCIFYRFWLYLCYNYGDIVCKAKAKQFWAVYPEEDG